jgi:diacylglycerol kinase (ATP)
VSVVVIINPVAGGAARTVGDRVELARRAALEFGESTETILTTQPGHARELARAARAAHARLVVAWGGDGTINEVVSELVSSDVIVGIVPSGSGNGLARELKLAPDPARALHAAFRGAPHPIDMGEINGRLFANIAGIGFDAAVASQFNDPANAKRGFGGYIRIVARTLVSYEPMRYTIAASGADRHVRAVLISFANGTQYGNGMRIAPEARVDDGVLNMVIVEERSRVNTILQLPRLFNGTIAMSPDCTVGTITEARITGDTPLALHVDGEPVESDSTATVRVLPGVLNVAV